MRAASDLLDRVMKHPMTSSLHRMELTGQQPFGLDVVRQRLRGGEFSTTDEVFVEIDNVWDRSIEIIPDGKFFADVNRQIVMKERRRLGLMAGGEWGHTVQALKNKMADLLLRPTKAVKAIVRNEFMNRQIEKPKIPLVTVNEYESFVAQTERLDEEELEGLAVLLRRFEPELEFNDLNVAELNVSTFRALEDHLKSIREKGVYV